MGYIFALRRDILSNFNTDNPVLADGEPAYCIDDNKLKIGNGVDDWATLPYLTTTSVVPDGDKTDITVSSSGTIWTIDNGAVTYSKIQNISTTDRLLGRSSSGAGTIEEIVCTAAGRSLIAGVDAAAQRSSLGLGTLATQNGTFSGTSSGTNTGDQNVFHRIMVAGQGNVDADSPTDELTLIAGTNITITTNPATDEITFSSTIPDGDKGDITVSGSGSTWTIDNDSVTYAKIQDISATDRILGRVSAGAGNIEEITCTSAGRALLDDVDNAAQRTTLGLGTMATQNASAVAITGGTVQDVTVTTGTYSSLANEAVLIPVRKASAGTITKGRPVYIVGSTGTNVTVELAQANAEATSAYTFGVAATDITTTGGFIIKSGLLTGLNNLPTATFADGDPIYLDETTAGGLRKTLPAAPNHGVFLGFVVKANNGNAGIMDVHIQNYQELEELSDVNISGVAADHFLKRNATNTRWENVSPANARTGLGLGTLATQSGTFSGTSSGTNTGDQTITLTGDVTGSGTGSFAATIANDAVTYAKIQNVSAGDRLLGRISGSGDVEEITCTAAGRNLLDDVDAAAQRTTLGLGTLATQSGTFSGTSSGTNTGDQTITLTGDVTGSGTGSFAATIANDAVTYAKIQNVSATDRLLGRSSAGSGDIEEIVCTAYARGLLDDIDSAAARSTLGAAASSHTHVASDVSAAGSSGQVMFNSSGAFAGDSGLTYDSTTDTLTVGSLAFGTNGEYIRNTVNGRVDFMPSPTAANVFGVYMDFTSFTVGARMGVIRSSDGVKNPSGSYIQFETQMAIVSDVNTVYGNSAECVMRLTSTGNETFQIAPSVAAGRSAAVAIVNQSHVGVATRSPATAHVDPTFYVYSSDATQANDFVRMAHDQTDGLIESGNGKLRLKGASVVRIEGPSGGFDLPATAGSNGQVLTTDGANASWQTPAGVTEDFVIAMAIAL